MLAVIGLMLAAVTATAAPSSADESRGTNRAGVELTGLGSGMRLLQDVDSPAELAAACPSGNFCGYASGWPQPLAWGCGAVSVGWSGGGWWYNNLTGTKTRVTMYTVGGGIYRTPPAPSQDTTADWTPVTSMVVCTA